MNHRSQQPQKASAPTWLQRLWNQMRGAFAKQPGSNLGDTRFKVFPHILKEGESYFLCYQIAMKPIKPLVKVLYSKIHEGKAYYFFSVPISHEEYGALVKRNVSEDGFTTYAKNGAVYWLNKDGTETHLETKNI